MTKDARIKPKNKCLNCTVTRDGVLRIEIGIDTLAFAALHSGYVYSLQGEGDCRDPSERFSIPNARGFALDVKAALLDEAEDGSNILTRAVDQATEHAIEQGTEFFVDAEDEA